MSLVVAHFAIFEFSASCPWLQGPTQRAIYFLLSYLLAAIFITACVDKIVSAFQSKQKSRRSLNKANIDSNDNKSHDIRTPLNNIIGAVEMLEERKLDDDTRREVEFIRDSADSLLIAIDSIDDLSAITAKSSTPNQENTTRTVNRNSKPNSDVSKISVLVVEDNRMSQEITVHKLNRAGFEVEVACNGHDAVRMAKNNSYDFILMDCQMPGMDGFEATRLIRGYEQSTKGKRTPIVALTAHAMEGYREICLSAGMDDYLTKPIKQQELTQFLGRFLLKKANEKSS